MEAKLKAELVQAAIEARERAWAPYSRFKVGAALLTPGGEVIPGVNVESASYGLTCCAERVAIFSAVAAGHREFSAIAIVAEINRGPMPCGACRQLLAEFAPRATVLVADTRSADVIREFNVADLLPEAFLEVPGA